MNSKLNQILKELNEESDEFIESRLYKLYT